MKIRLSLKARGANANPILVMKQGLIKKPEEKLWKNKS